jgi:hypothetical protein
MAKFRKKPVVIDAIRCATAHIMMGEDWYSLPEWFRDAYDGKNEAGVKTVISLNNPPRIDVVTLEGVMTANIEDWIIKGVKGELYPCKPDIFKATYEAED